MSQDDAKKEAGKLGGLKRAERLTPIQLRAQAQRAAAARWGKPLVATHKGSFQKDFGVDVECYVLDDATRTAVISQIGMARALGLSPRGNALPRFVASNAMRDTLGADLRGKIGNPLKFQWGTPGAPEGYLANIHGFDAAVLIELCQAIIKADKEGKLDPQQRKIAINAAILVSASAKQGIRDLVYALAGYDQTADQVIQAFKVYVQEEARKYEPEFPAALYQQWYRLYQIPVHPGRGWPWHFKHLTVRHVYFPLAKSNGKLLELLYALKASGGDQKKKLFQFLNEVGSKALSRQIGRLLEMTETSTNRTEYENKIAERFGGQQELDLIVPPEPTAAQAS